MRVRVQKSVVHGLGVCLKGINTVVGNCCKHFLKGTKRKFAAVYKDYFRPPVSSGVVAIRGTAKSVCVFVVPVLVVQ